MKAPKQQDILVGTLFLLPFTLLACVTVLLFSSHREMDQSYKWVARSHDVINQIQSLMETMLDAETAHQDYLLGAGADAFATYQTASDSIPKEMGLLHHLASDHSSQQDNLLRLEKQVVRRLDFLARTSALKQKGQDLEALRHWHTGEGRDALEEIRELMPAIAGYENDLLRRRELLATEHAGFSHHLAVSLMLLDTLALAAIAYMLKRMHSLNRIVTVCAWSRTIKSDGRWISFEAYLREQFGLSVTHGMSREVYEKLMNEPDEQSKP